MGCFCISCSGNWIIGYVRELDGCVDSKETWGGIGKIIGCFGEWEGEWGALWIVWSS